MTTRRRSRIAGLAVASGLLAAACSGGSDTADTTTETSATTAEAAESAEATPDASAGGAVPDVFAFSSPLVGGGELDAATLADKPTAFWFWSPT